MSKKQSVLEPEQVIYCGPNIPGGVLSQYAVFRNGIPLHVADLFGKCPAAERLTVPVTLLSETRKAISEMGTPQHIWFGQVQDYIAGGDKQ